MTDLIRIRNRFPLRAGRPPRHIHDRRGDPGTRRPGAVSAASEPRVARKHQYRLAGVLCRWRNRAPSNRVRSPGFYVKRRAVDTAVPPAVSKPANQPRVVRVNDMIQAMFSSARDPANRAARHRQSCPRVIAPEGPGALHAAGGGAPPPRSSELQLSLPGTKSCGG